MPAYTYNVMRPHGYSDLSVPNIWEIKFERDFVLFFDATGMKQCIRSESISRIERLAT